MVIASCCAAAANNKNSNAERVNDDPPSADLDFDLVDYSYQGLSELPKFIVQNALAIKHLILDGNQLDEQAFEDVRFTRLESLSFNCNRLENIGVFIQFLSHKCPNLRFLSLIDNPGWPHPLRTSDLYLYKKYRHAILKFFPKLRFLDSVEVDSQRKSSTASITSTSSRYSCSSTD